MLLLQSLVQGICLKIETIARANSEAQSNPVRLAYPTDQVLKDRHL